MKNTTTTTNAAAAKQTAHTPGPWTVQPGGYCRSVIHRAGHPDQVVANTYGNEETAAANACLLAAAPELLAALAMFLDRIDRNNVPVPSYFAHALDTARAAISKATGGAK